VITVHNRPDYFLACVRSLLEQDFPRDRFEIVAVDDASELPCMAETMAQAEKQAAARGVRFIEEFLGSNLGPGEARNRGNDLSSGRIIVVCDSDDISNRGRLQVVSRFFKDFPMKKIFFSGGMRVDRDLENPVQHHASVQQVFSLDHHQEIWHPTMAYRADICRGPGAPVRYPAEPADVDYHFLLQARKVLGAEAFGCVDLPLVLYRSNPEQISKARRGTQNELFIVHQGEFGLKQRPKLFMTAPSNYERHKMKRKRRRAR